MEKKTKIEKPYSPQWTLAQTILSQLRAAGYDADMDCFGDRSGSWIQFEKKRPEGKVGKYLSFSMAFNYEGTQITGLRVFQEESRIGNAEAYEIK